MFSPFASWLGIASLGAAIGAGQWLVLRRRIPGVEWWIPATLGGWLVGFAALEAKPSFHEEDFGLVRVSVMAASVGIAQWLVLRRSTQGAGWWAVATVGAIVLSEQLNEIVGSAAAGVPAGQHAVKYWARYLLPWAIQGTVIGALVAPFSLRLLQSQSRPASSGEVPPVQSGGGDQALERGAIGKILFLLSHPVSSAASLPARTTWDHPLAIRLLAICSAFITGNYFLARLTYRSYPQGGIGELVAETYMVALMSLLGGALLWHSVFLVGLALKKALGRDLATSPGRIADRALIVGTVGLTLAVVLLLILWLALFAGFGGDHWVRATLELSVQAAFLATIILVVVLVTSSLVRRPRA